MTEFEAKFKLTAKDEATPKIETATQKILREYKALRQEQKASRGEFELNNRVLVDAGRAFRAVGSIAGSLTNIYTKYNVMQLRISESNKRLKEAQEDYNRTLAETGPGSEQSIRAARDLTDAKEEATRAQQEQTLGMIGFGFELASSISLIISAIPKFKELANTLKAVKEGSVATAAVTAGATATTAATTAGGAAATAGGVGAATGGIGLAASLTGALQGIVASGAFATTLPLVASQFLDLIPGMKEFQSFVGEKLRGLGQIDATSLDQAAYDFFSSFRKEKTSESTSEKLIIQIENKGDQELFVKSKPTNVEVLVSDQ